MKLAKINFAGNKITTIRDDESIVWVAMRTIVESIGLAWQSQHSKLIERKEEFSTVTLRVTVGGDGKLREMVCIPLKKLADSSHCCD